MLILQFTWKLIFFYYDIFKMIFILIICVDIKTWLILVIFSSFLTEIKFKKYEQYICNNMWLIILKCVDDFTLILNRYLYVKRWSMKFWLKLQLINVIIVFICRYIKFHRRSHVRKFFLTFLNVNTWIILIDFDFFSCFCRNRCFCIEIYNDRDIIIW